MKIYYLRILLSENKLPMLTLAQVPKEASDKNHLPYNLLDDNSCDISQLLHGNNFLHQNLILKNNKFC